MSQSASQSDDQILSTFEHHVPSHLQTKMIQLNRAAARNFAAVILSSTPEGADRDTAIRYVHEAMMTANKAIVNMPPVHEALGLAQAVGGAYVHGR